MSEILPPANSVPLSAMDPTGLEGLRRRLAAAQANGDPHSAEKAAKDFESVLLYKLMEEMRRTIPESGLLSTGISQQVRGLFWYYLAQGVAEQGGLGLWRAISAEMDGQGGKPPVPASTGEVR